jgi:hypothetical protein
VRKNCSSDRKKNLSFEITRTIYSNSESSEQFLVSNRMLFKLLPGGFSYLIN